MALAPIIVFAYNRPDLLRQTLNALMQNDLADESTMYIFCDGPKPNSTVEQLNSITEVRKVAHSKQWCKDVFIFESDRNKGLGTSIITGVTEVLEKHGKGIIVEDDLITSPMFLLYMNQCLDHYECRKSVFSISAVSRPHPDRFFPVDYPYDVYVSLTHRPWGWATWRDRWNQVDWQANAYQIIKNNPAMKEAFNRLGADYYDALSYQQEKNQNVWSIRFALAHFVNHAVSICPISSYINNIGWGEAATNTKASGSNWNIVSLNSNHSIRFVDVLYEDKRIINAWYSFSISKRRSLIGKLRNWYGRRFLNRDEFVLKGKVFY